LNQFSIVKVTINYISYSKLIFYFLINFKSQTHIDFVLKI